MPRRRSRMPSLLGLVGVILLLGFGAFVGPATARTAPDLGSGPGRAPAPATAVGPGGAACPAAPPHRPRWVWPLAPRPPILRAFQAPVSSWGAGHRGLDLAARSGQAVTAVEGGVVTHVGMVAGRPTVTLRHTDGLRSTYEPVIAEVTVGECVAAGSRLGTLDTVGWHCPAACLHLGAVRDVSYLDPLPLLGFWRVRLLPLT